MICAASRCDIPRVLLIDLDNCPQQVANLPSQLEDYVRIIGCHGSVEPKLPLSLAIALATAIHEQKLEFVGMAKNGKNAADFGLTFLAGRMLAEMPRETEFIILSKDGDLDHAVNMLRREGRVASRLDESPLSRMTIDDAVEEYYSGRLQTQTIRPKRRRTLLSSIRSFFKGRSDADAQEVFASLVKRGLVVVNSEGLANYPELDNR